MIGPNPYIVVSVITRLPGYSGGACDHREKKKGKKKEDFFFVLGAYTALSGMMTTAGGMHTALSGMMTTAMGMARAPAGLLMAMAMASSASGSSLAGTKPNILVGSAPTASK